jgi:predicted Zn-dependent protease
MNLLKIGTIVSVIGLLLSGCASTTMLGTMKSERKQFLAYPAAQFQTDSDAVYAKTISEHTTVNNPVVNRVTKRLIKQAPIYRPDAAQWNWTVYTLKADTLNAFCAAGGKMAIYTGLIDRLQLSEDEIAAVMSHEVAHALREHGRERASLSYVKNVGLGLALSAAGMGQSANQAVAIATELGFDLPNSRKHETEADLIGIEMMARAGYNPEAAISVWQKMQKINGDNSVAFLSTHPTPKNRIEEIQKHIEIVKPLYLAANQSK